MRTNGFKLDFDLIEDVPHEEARRRVARADIFVDQLHAGFFGGAAVEAMAMGKPTLCLLCEADLVFLPTGMRHELPIVRCDAASLTERLAGLLTSGDLGAIGALSRAFVERWHAPRAVAGITVADYAAARSGAQLLEPAK